jgi:hypothetical protein
MQGVVPNNEAIVALALNKFGTYTALIMLVGMAFNILIARITRFKYAKATIASLFGTTPCILKAAWNISPKGANEPSITPAPAVTTKNVSRNGL